MACNCTACSKYSSFGSGDKMDRIKSITVEFEDGITGVFSGKQTNLQGALDVLQGLDRKSQVYGHDGTIHQTTHLDVETYKGRVTAVWFRCATLAFEQHEVNEDRFLDMQEDDGQNIVAVEFAPKNKKQLTIEQINENKLRRSAGLPDKYTYISHSSTSPHRASSKPF